MAVVLSQKVGVVKFACPWCGKWHKVNLYQDAAEEPDDYGDVLIGPPANRLACKCGADLLVLGDQLGDPADFDVIWCNREDMLLQAWLRLKPQIKPIFGAYYDLVRVPHGHVPVTKVFLWRRLPIVVREIRGDDYFRCPECGEPSFFKIERLCMLCYCRLNELRHSSREVWFKTVVSRDVRVARRERQDYFRNILKRLECLVLPILVLSGKAWYVRSKRRKYPIDYQRAFLRAHYGDT